MFFNYKIKTNVLNKRHENTAKGLIKWTIGKVGNSLPAKVVRFKAPQSYGKNKKIYIIDKSYSKQTNKQINK